MKEKQIKEETKERNQRKKERKKERRGRRRNTISTGSFPGFSGSRSS